MSNGKVLAAVVFTLAVSLIPIYLQRQEIGRLREELAGAQVRAAPAPDRPDVAPQSDDAAKREEQLQGEVARLRGAESRALRAEAEVAQLKARLEEQHPQTRAELSSTTASVSDPLIAVLGTPTPPPANLDPAYSKDGLLAALQLAAQNAGVQLKAVEVDDTEFPSLLGVVCADGDLDKLKQQLTKMEGYDYGASVGNSGRAAFSIVPNRALPPGEASRIGRRTLLREQAFFDRLPAQP